MNSTVLEFIKDHRIAVLATTLTLERIHASTIHYSHDTEPSFRLIFQTDKSTRKAHDILEGTSAKAAVVIGFSEKEWKTVQMEGLVRRILAHELVEKSRKVHHEKFPGVLEYSKENSIFLEFIPIWWRYTDFTTVPLTVFTND